MNDLMLSLAPVVSPGGRHPENLLAHLLVAPGVTLQPLSSDANDIEVRDPHDLELKAELGEAAGVRDLAPEDVSLLLDGHALVHQGSGELCEDGVWVVVGGGGHVTQPLPSHCNRPVHAVQPFPRCQHVLHFVQASLDATEKLLLPALIGRGLAARARPGCWRDRSSEDVHPVIQRFARGQDVLLTNLLCGSPRRPDRRQEVLLVIVCLLLVLDRLLVGDVVALTRSVLVASPLEGRGGSLLGLLTDLAAHWITVSVSGCGGCADVEEGEIVQPPLEAGVEAPGAVGDVAGLV